MVTTQIPPTTPNSALDYKQKKTQAAVLARPAFLGLPQPTLSETCIDRHPRQSTYNIHRAAADTELAQLRLTDGIRLIRRTSTALFLGQCSKVEVLECQDSNVSKRLFIKTPEIAAT